MDTTEAAELVVNNGGGTFYAYDGSIYPPQPPSNSQSAWVVAIKPFDHVGGQHGRNRKVELESVETGYVREQLFRFLVDDYQGNGHMFGAWLDGNTLYIDHVTFTTKEGATRAAQAAGELAIFNLKTEETVFV